MSGLVRMDGIEMAITIAVLKMKVIYFITIPLNVAIDNNLLVTSILQISNK